MTQGDGGDLPLINTKQQSSLKRPLFLSRKVLQNSISKLKKSGLFKFPKRFLTASDL